MKTNLITLILLLACISFLNAQEGKNFLTNPDGDICPETTDYSGKYHLQKSEYNFKSSQYDVDPGVYPEGDYMGNSAFTPDGSKIILTNRITDIVTVYDWESMEAIANIEVGEYPSCVKANNDYAVIGCQFSDSLFIIDLSDYSIAGILPTGEQPCSIELSPDGNLAYVACDIDDVCQAFDIATQTYIGQIEGFPIYLNVFSWAVQVNRGWEKYNGFLVLPGGEMIAATHPDGDVIFYSTNTYQEVQRVTISDPRAIAISGDGNFMACVENPDNECYVHQIDLSDFSITNTVQITGYGLGTNAIVVNQDGSKAYIGTNSNTSTLVKFNTQDFITFTGTYTAFWLGVSPDHNYAVSGQNRFSIIDFEDESIADQHIGLNQSFGAVSPVSNHVFAYDPLRYEGAYFFDFTDPEDIVYRGSMLSGLDPEGDTPGAVAISNDRTIAIAAGNLSYNCPVLDLESMQAINSVPLEESCYDVAITPDGQWGIAGGYNLNTVKIIDLSDNSLATTVYTGQRPMVVEMSPDGQHAYIGNIKQNTLSVLEIDGANSSVVTSVPCGVIGVYIPFFGIRSAVKASPDGKTVLVTASFDDELKVFDTESNQIVAELTTGDFPLDVEYNEDGTIACVVNTFDASFDIVSVNGASSSVLYHNFLSGDYPMDVSYNPDEGLFYICSANSDRIFKIDPASGDVVETQYLTAPFHIEFHNGDPIIQCQGDDVNNHKILYGETEFILPYAAAPFSFNPEAEMIGVPMPGPDMVSIIDLSVNPYIGEKNNNNMVSIYPNPATSMIHIKNASNFNTIEILDIEGSLILKNKIGITDNLDLGKLPRGTYVIRLTNNDISYQQLLIKK